MSFGGVALGCGNFGGIGSAPEFFGQGIDDDDGVRDHGHAPGRAASRWFDTGDAYGGGTSERWIGEWTRRARAGRAELDDEGLPFDRPATPGDDGLAPDRIRRQLEGSLERLGVDAGRLLPRARSRTRPCRSPTPSPASSRCATRA